MTETGAEIIDELRKSLATSAEIDSDAFAHAADLADPLASFREKFHIPKASHAIDAPDAIYFAGNSLGPLPKSTRGVIEEELKKWEVAAVEGHFLGTRPWARIDERVTHMSAAIVGALPHEVAVMNSLSVNLHLMLTSFYRPSARRWRILLEDNAFCSDQHVLSSQVLLHGLDPKSALIRATPRPGEHTIRNEDVLELLAKEGHSICLVMLGAVQFYSGQLFDIKAITRAAHAHGVVAAFDCAHAAGNVPLQLHDWGVDWACWCTYKYMNAGPGAIAGMFLHERHATKSLQELPRLCGWWGQTLENRFGMSREWVMKPGAQSYMISNPSVLATLPLEAALQVHTQAGMPALRTKSRRLTAYLEALLERIPHSTRHFVVLTPRDPEQRGCQLSLLLARPVRAVNEHLFKHGVVCDVREPNVLRVSPAPLFNSFRDVLRFVRLFNEVLASVPPKL